jgi:preprotein translocase subunit SecF
VRIQDGAEGADAHDESGETAAAVSQLLIDAAGGQATFGGSAYVGAQVGDELKERGGMGMLVATVLLMIYIALRFQFKFSVGAVLSVAHDVVITLGFLAITQLDFDLNVLASILAIIGYSLNDTVVVADRIRENYRIMRGAEPEEIVDTAVSQTLIRTTITAVTTLLVLFALFFFGGPVLYGFSLILIVGVVIGTYSSIYVASSALMFLHLSKEDMLPPEKETSDLDAIP